MPLPHWARKAGIVALFIVAAALGVATGVIFVYAGDLPTISALDDYAPSTISRVYGSRGEIVGEFAIERREVIPYERISPKLEQAVLAAEDHDFYQHIGLSIPRIVVTLVKDIIERRLHGASTLTQQLARKLFLTDDKTWERKIREALLAIQIEKRYTKREIFTLYCNQMYFGHGVYGVEAASRLYFGKSAKDVTLEEAALIAGILQGNVRQSPYVNREAALRRRNYALTRMAEVGYITQAEAEEAKKKPIVTKPDPPGQSLSAAPYFLEDVRRELESRYGAKQLYENGLSIQTAIDLRLQEAATRAL
jgi:penicillin-binding protein 1A